jgi:hypothetical protein
MVDLRLDADVSEALESGVGSIADPAERESVSGFLEAVNASRSEPNVERLEAVAAAGQEAYESRTPELHLGWQKVILVETGLAGERLEGQDSHRSYEIMLWSYDHCKEHGYSIDDVDKGRRWVSTCTTSTSRLSRTCHYHLRHRVQSPCKVLPPRVQGA